MLFHFQAIHKKIMELNFRNCYSRIKSVDSQKTINGGVVVQVGHCVLLLLLLLTIYLK